MQKIVPHLWFDSNALLAIEQYVSVFCDSKISETNMIYDTPSGDAQTIDFELFGIKFAAINAGPYFRFNSSISFMIACETKEEVDTYYGALVKDGVIRMPLGDYEFSHWYAWIQDKYGVDWQFMLVDDKAKHQKIRPCLLFGKEVCGKAHEAIKQYMDVFEDASCGFLSYYEKEEAFDPRAKIKYSELKLFDFDFVIMDHGYGGEDIFNEAISFMVLCDDQNEIDRYWEALSYVKEAEACGWVKDAFGLSWQIIPRNLGEIMQSNSEEEMQRIMKTFLSMKKIDIAVLKHAGKGEL